MEYYPIFLKLAEQPCTVVGGGRVAERKVRGLLKCGARVTVISPELTAGLAVLHEQAKIAWLARAFLEGDLAETFMVIAATDDIEVQRLVHGEASRRRLLLNVADVPDLCGFILPATARSGDLAISVSTAGKSPALARKLRLELEKRFGPEYKVLVELLGLLRPAVMTAGRPQPENEALFNRLLHDDMPVWIKNRTWGKIETHLLETLGELLPPTLLAQLRDLVMAGR